MASTYLTKTFSSGGNQRIWTSSFWVKLNIASGEDNYIYTYAQSSGATPRGSMEFRSDANGNTFRVGFNPTGSSWINCDVDNRKFIDYSAFYHVVVAVDTTQATASNRVKIYINGEQQTVSTQPSQNFDTGFNHTHQTSFGRYENADSSYFSGVLSHINFIDGTQYTASTFGETDSTSGIWKPKTSPSVTYGSNGFFLKFENSGAMGTDSSGNSNTFTVSGNLTQNVDTPSNNFATLNPLYNQTGGQGVVLANGNTRCSYSPNSSRSAFGTIAVGTGKYYYEAKLESAGTAPVVGVVDLAWPDINGASGYAFHDSALNFGYDVGGQKTSGGSASAFGSALNNNDIVQVAMDLDNSKLYFGVNGTWQSSGDPTSGSTGTGSAYNLASDTLYTSACRIRNGGDWSFNFGQGYFGTTSVASAGTAPSGGGIFEFDCPSGYQSLSTKGINSF